MNELITVNYTENEQPTVSGRELHEALEVETRYNDWFKRMSEYGFTENTDFYSILSKTPEGGRPSTALMAQSEKPRLLRSQEKVRFFS